MKNETNLLVQVIDAMVLNGRVTPLQAIITLATAKNAPVIFALAGLKFTGMQSVDIATLQNTFDNYFDN